MNFVKPTIKVGTIAVKMSPVTSKTDADSTRRIQYSGFRRIYLKQ
jgi:hypothetical protein